MNIHIKDVALIPSDGIHDYFEKVNIYIKNDEFFHIGDELMDFQADKVIDGSKMMAMPGLVNAHTHVGMSLLRNFADDLPLHDWLENKIWPVEAQLSPDDIYWGSLLSMAEMIESGTTCFNDMYFAIDRVAEGLKESGMRGCLGRGLTLGSEEENLEQFEDVEFLHGKWNGAENDRIRIVVSPHAVYTSDADFLEKSRDLSEKLDTILHIHLSETEKEERDTREAYGKSATEYCHDLDLFNRPTVAAHCVHLSDSDIEIFKEKNIIPVNNPTSNLKLASGFARIDKLLKEGIPVALGTDGSSSNNNLNMFEEIHIAAILNKALNKDATSVSSKEVINMATINGAKALRWDDKIGSVEVGKKADLILIDMDKTHFYPIYNIVSAATYTCQGSDVDTVIIDGKIVYENKEHKTLDIDKIRSEVARIGEKIKRL